MFKIASTFYSFVVKQRWLMAALSVTFLRAAKRMWLSWSVGKTELCSGFHSLEKKSGNVMQINTFEVLIFEWKDDYCRETGSHGVQLVKFNPNPSGQGFVTLESKASQWVSRASEKEVDRILMKGSGWKVSDLPMCPHVKWGSLRVKRDVLKKRSHQDFCD